MPNPGQKQRRQTSDNKHGPPAKPAADAVVGQRGEKYADVISGMHQTRTHTAPMLRPLLRHKRPAHGPFSANADAGQQAEDSQLPHASGERAQKGECRIPHDGEHERAHTAELVSNRSPKKRQSPADQE